MDDISITKEEYTRLVYLQARVDALTAYVNRSKYSIERCLIGDILGFSANEVEDGTD